MEDELSPHLQRLTVAFAILAVTCAGFGGLAEPGPMRTLLGAGASFWLLMLIVPMIFVSGKGWSNLTLSGLHTAWGALSGACYGLFFEHGGFAVVQSTAVGAAVGFFGYWTTYLKTGRPWRGGVGGIDR